MDNNQQNQNWQNPQDGGENTSQDQQPTVPPQNPPVEGGENGQEGQTPPAEGGDEGENGGADHTTPEGQ